MMKQISTLLVMLIITSTLSIAPAQGGNDELTKIADMAQAIVISDDYNTNDIILSGTDIESIDEIISLMSTIDKTTNKMETLQFLSNLVRNLIAMKLKHNLKGDLFDFSMSNKDNRVFIFSHGKSRMSHPMKQLQFRFLRPSSFFWFYSDKADGMMKSKTIIVDPTPYSTKVLDGTQIGVVRHFAGLYIYLPETARKDSSTFFIGYARMAHGFDLSP